MEDYTDLKRRLGEPIISQAHEDRLITSGPLAERLIRERMEASNAISTLEKELARMRVLDKAMKAFLAGEPSNPPVTGKEKTKL